MPNETNKPLCFDWEDDDEKSPPRPRKSVFKSISKRTSERLSATFSLEAQPMLKQVPPMPAVKKKIPATDPVIEYHWSEPIRQTEPASYQEEPSLYKKFIEPITYEPNEPITYRTNRFSTNLLSDESMSRDTIYPKPYVQKAFKPYKFSTGLKTLDTVTHGGLPAGGLMVIAGPPNCGKTHFLQHIKNHQPNIVWQHPEEEEQLMAKSGVIDAIFMWEKNGHLKGFSSPNFSTYEATHNVREKWLKKQTAGFFGVTTKINKINPNPNLFGKIAYVPKALSHAANVILKLSPVGVGIGGTHIKVFIIKNLEAMYGDLMHSEFMVILDDEGNIYEI